MSKDISLLKKLTYNFNDAKVFKITEIKIIAILENSNTPVLLLFQKSHLLS